ARARSWAGAGGTSAAVSVPATRIVATIGGLVFMMMLLRTRAPARVKIHACTGQKASCAEVKACRRRVRCKIVRDFGHLVSMCRARLSYPISNAHATRARYQAAA